MSGRLIDLGRIVLPRELRKVLEINERDSLEIFVDGNFVMLQKYEPSCIFCGNVENVNRYKGKNICQHCMDALKRPEGAPLAATDPAPRTLPVI